MRAVRFRTFALLWLSTFLPILTLVVGGCVNTNDNGSGVAANANQLVGCFSPGMTPTSQGQCGVAPSFGDPTLDAGFAGEISIQSSFWSGIPANPQPWIDCQSPNAISLPSHDILLGINLFQKLVAQANGDTLPLAGVIAHEWGHQVQFENGWMVQTEPTARPIELEADAFSGYYMALEKGWAWAFIDDYFNTLASLGTYDFGDPGFHGTPQERVTAGQLGFNAGVQVLQTGQPFSYGDLHQIFSSAIQTFMVNRTIVVPAMANQRVRSFLVLLCHKRAQALLSADARTLPVLISCAHERLFLGARHATKTLCGLLEQPGASRRAC